MEKNKNIPKLRFPEFSEEWKEKRLENLFEVFRSGNGITSDKISDEGDYPVYGGNGLRGYANEYTHDGFYLLVGRQGALCGNVNRSNGKAYISEHAVAGKANKNSDTEWLAQRLDYQNLNRLSESSAQPGLSVAKLLRFKLVVPTLPEQQKIASFLTAVDEKLTALKKKKELLEQYKKGVMQGIFCQNQKSLNHDSPDYLDGQDVKSGKSSPSQKSRFRQLRFKDDNGKDFPKWNYKHGNEIFDSISDKNHNSDLPILAITQEHGAIPRELIDYNISVTEASVESYKVVQKGDFIISLRSFQGGIEYSEYKGICSPAYIILRSKITIDDRFFKSYLKTESYIKELNKKLEGIRDGKMISYKYFSEVKLPYPCLEEQTKIANFLSAIDKKIDQCQLQIEQTTQWKKGLLQKMFC